MSPATLSSRTEAAALLSLLQLARPAEAAVTLSFEARSTLTIRYHGDEIVKVSARRPGLFADGIVALIVAYDRVGVRLDECESFISEAQLQRSEFYQDLSALLLRVVNDAEAHSWNLLLQPKRTGWKVMLSHNGQALSAATHHDLFGALHAAYRDVS